MTATKSVLDSLRPWSQHGLCACRADEFGPKLQTVRRSWELRQNNKGGNERLWHPGDSARIPRACPKPCAGSHWSGKWASCMKESIVDGEAESPWCHRRETPRLRVCSLLLRRLHRSWLGRFDADCDDACRWCNQSTRARSHGRACQSRGGLRSCRRGNRSKCFLECTARETLRSGPAK